MSNIDNKIWNGINSDLIEERVKGVNFIPYNEIKYMKSIDILLGENDMACILYHTKIDFGHFVCLYKHNNRLYYFDSYGRDPDDSFRFISPEIRIKMNEIEPYLFELIAQSGLICEYNDYRLQGYRTQTCGRWCICRLLNRDLSVEEFAKQFYDLAYKNNTSTDRILVRLGY
jgi:hypothetical protein